MASFEVTDVKKYRQVNGKDWWFVSFSGSEGTYSWQPGGELHRTSASLRATMAEMRRRYIQQQYYRHQYLIGLLWLLGGVSLTLVSFGVVEGWDDLRAAPIGMRLYTLTLPCCWWVLLCCLLSVSFAVAAIALSLNPPRCVRARQSTRSKIGSRSGRSPSPARRRRASPYGRRRRARSPHAAAAAAGDSVTLLREADLTTAAGESSDSGGLYGSEEQQHQQQQQQQGPYGSAEAALSKGEVLLSRNPLVYTKVLNPKPSMEAAADAAPLQRSTSSGSVSLSRQGSAARRQGSLQRQKSGKK